MKTLFKIYWLIAILIGLTINSIGQTEVGISRDSETDYSFFTKPIPPAYYNVNKANIPIHSLDSLTISERKRIEESINPVAIGVLRDLKSPIIFKFDSAEIQKNLNKEFNGGWLTTLNEDTLIWTTMIKSLGADEVRVYFSEGYFPEGVLVNLFNQNSEGYNQSELKNNLNIDGFFTTTTFDNTVTIQLILPVNVLHQEISFKIPSIIHAEKQHYLKNNTKSDCDEDVNCSFAQAFSGIQNLKKSTAKIKALVNSVYVYGTGVLLADNRPIDNQPFLLTDIINVNDQSSAISIEATFDYFTNSCNGSTNIYTETVNGGNFLVGTITNRFALVLLKQKLYQRIYLGWTTSTPSNNSILHSVHHADWETQLYTKLEKKNNPDYNCTYLYPTTNFYYARNLGGYIWENAEGAPIANSNSQLIGIASTRCHSGFYEPCLYGSYNLIISRFDKTYSDNNLSFWLNNGGASVSMDTYPDNMLSFGPVLINSDADNNVTIYNNGTVPTHLNLEVTSSEIAGVNANQFSIIGNTMLYIPPGESESLQIRFSPTSSGNKQAALKIYHNADNLSSPKIIQLTGIGVSNCLNCPEYNFEIFPNLTWQTHVSSINEQGCKMYKISVDDGKLYTFKTGCGNGATANFDTQLRLINSNCNEVAIADDNCESNRDKLEWTATYTGDIYLKVSGYSSNYGNYTMAYKKENPPDPNITLDPTNETVSSASGSTTVDVTANVSWTVSESCNWVSCSPTGGSNNGSFTVTYQANTSSQQRICTITVSGGGETKTFVLTQQGLSSFITLSPASQTVNSNSGSVNVSVTSNVSWTVSESCDWVSCSPTGGSNNGSFTVTYQANTSSQQRICTITVSGGGETKTFVLTQQGLSSFITLSPASQTVNSNSGSVNVSVTSNVSWTVSESCDWVTCSPTGGSNNGSFTVTYQANTIAQSRTCNISVSSGEITVLFTLNQSASVSFFLEAMPGQLLLDANQGSIGQLFISSNDNWSIQNHPAWLLVNPISGIGNQNVNFTTLTENTTSSERNANIFISAVNAGSKYILVSQMPYIGIDERSDQNDLIIKPNPTTGEVTITTGCDHNYELLIYNNLGNLIYIQQNIENEKTLNLSYLPQGVYIIKINCNNILKMTKLIKI